MDLNNLYLALAFLVTLMTLLITSYDLKTFPKRIRKTILKKKQPPRVSGGWPLIGHLNVLSGPELPHLALSNFADKYGPIFTLQLGMRRAVVISSRDIARECFTNQNDVIFANRPKIEAIQYMGYNFAIFGFKEPGPYWRELRKVTTSTLLSNQSVAKLADIREVEVGAMMKSLYKTCGNIEEDRKTVVEMKRVFQDLTLNFVLRIVFGEVKDEEKEMLRDPIKEFFRGMGVITLPDVVPILKWFGCFGGMKEVFKKTGEKMDRVLQSMIEHKKLGKGLCKSFMRQMMDVADRVSREFPEYDADTIIKATCESVILGGTETMQVTLIWALCLLLNNRSTLKRAQQELDSCIGQGRLVKESDLENLVYLRAVMKETLRICPAEPLLAPRLSSGDTTVAGYHVPSGTQLIINADKLQKDPEVWPDPLRFKPERFLDDDGLNKDVDFRGRDFEFIPFGAGRRVCPGISFATRMMEFSLASFLHGFEIDTVVPGEAVDMTGSFGATNMKATPLELVLKPRLCPEAYFVA